MSDFTHFEDVTYEYPPEEIREKKVMAIFSYISWLVLVPLIFARKSRYVLFNVNQGIILAAVEIVSWTTLGLLAKLPLIGWTFAIPNAIITLICTVYSVFGVVNAARGRPKKLPLISRVTLFK